MAEHPMNPENGSQPVKLLIRQPGSKTPDVPNQTQPVVQNKPSVAEPKKTIGQKLAPYMFGEEVSEPGKYIYKSYLEPTGKRVANDIVEHFLLMLKHGFQRWLWGKTFDDGKWGVDRTSFSNYSRRGNEPIKAMVMMSPVKELTFDKESDARKVLRELVDTAHEEGGYVTVRQYYEASNCPELIESNGVSSASGWSESAISKLDVKAAPDGGYMIPLPRPQSLSTH